MKTSVKNLDWSNLGKNLGILLAVIVIVCLVGYVLFPFIAWVFQTGPSLICAVSTAILFVVSLCCAFIPNVRGAKYWFFMGIGTFVCCLILDKHYYGYEYHGDRIIKCGYGGCGLANKWGFTVIPCEDGQHYIYAVKNKETNKTETIGMSWDENEKKCDGYDDKESSEYHLSKCERILFIYSGESLIKLDTVSLYYNLYDSNIDYTKDDYKTSLYEYIESNYGSVKYAYGYGFKILKYSYLRSTSKSNKGNDGYEDIGETNGIYEWPSGELSTGEGYHLWLKSIGGEHFYYASWGVYGEKHLLSKGSWTIEGKRYNAMYQNGKFKHYLNVSAWPSAGSEGSSSSGGSSHVVVEQSGPRQEWVPCPACGNSLRLGLCQNCNGTGEDLYYTRGYRACPSCGGFGKCSMCAGQGGHYETRF